MDFFFLALESPLFPGALLALFFALAARALTQEAEVALPDAPRILPTAQAPPVVSAASPAPPQPEPQAQIKEDASAAVCAELDSDLLASDSPIRWL